MAVAAGRLETAVLANEWQALAMRTFFFKFGASQSINVEVSVSCQVVKSFSLLSSCQVVLLSHEVRL